MEINLSKLLEKRVGKMKYKEFSKFPGIKKDLAIVVDTNITSKNVEEVIKKAVKAENVTYSDDLITCNINLDKDSVVLLSIPYSDGWSVTIDDTPVKVYNSNIYYIAVDAIKGSHTIRYSYSAYR